MLVNFVNESSLELMDISLIENRPVTSWFSAACAASIAHKNLFCKNSCLNKSVSKAKFSLASDRV